MLLYATNGGVWNYPIRITYSFVPDGTNIAGVPSSLFSTLNSELPTAVWQQDFEQAAALWETVANLNLSLVPDGGAPMGSWGYQQGDPSMGDIRISMIPQRAGVLAWTTLPPPINGGTDAGDIAFNSNYSWAANTGYDLETVALHEFGHALGLDHSSLMSAVMYAYYTGTNQTPTSDDISGIDSVYGGIPAPYGTNHSYASPWNLSTLINSNGQVALANQSILGSGEQDWWSIQVPANTNGTMTVTMQAGNLSSLAPSLLVLNSSWNVVGQVNLANQYGANATVTVNGVVPGQKYLIRDTAASSIGSAGAYGLLINFGSSPQAPIAPPKTQVYPQPSVGGGASNELIGSAANALASLSTNLPGNLVSVLNGLPGSLNPSFNVIGFLKSVLSGTGVDLSSTYPNGEAFTVDPNLKGTPAFHPHPTHPFGWPLGSVVTGTRPEPSTTAAPANLSVPSTFVGPAFEAGTTPQTQDPAAAELTAAAPAVPNGRVALATHTRHRQTG
jgi:hypothetical protein